MKVLVTYGKDRGETAAIADAIGDGLRQDGHKVDVFPAEDIWGIESWDAVVVGSAETVSGWDRQARRFLKRHDEQLQALRVAFFSNVPSGEQAAERDRETSRLVQRWMDKVGALDHETFFHDTGDERQEADINADLAQAWGFRLGEELSRMPDASKHVPEMPSLTQRVVRVAFIIASLFAGVAALAGTVEHIAWPDAVPRLAVSVEGLRDTPFGSYLVPALLLAFFVAIPNLAAGIWEIRRNHRAEITGVIGGGAMCTWVILEMITLGANSTLDFFYLGLGLLTLVTAFWTWLGRNSRQSSALSTVE